MSSELIFTLGFVIGLLVGVLTGGFLMCCFVVAKDGQDEKEID